MVFGFLDRQNSSDPMTHKLRCSWQQPNKPHVFGSAIRLTDQDSQGPFFLLRTRSALLRDPVTPANWGPKDRRFGAHLAERNDSRLDVQQMSASGCSQKSSCD